MNSYNMRAFTLNDELYTFSMLDIPIRITEKEFILAMKPRSPILKIDNIMRGMDLPNIFEGDIISGDGVVYLVHYLRGFRASDSDGIVKHLYEFKDIQVISNIFNTDFPIKAALKKKLLFKYRDRKLKMENITGIYKNHMVVRGITTKLDPSELQQEAGFSYKGNTVFFGDMIEGYPVELYYGRPCICKPEGMYDIIKKQIIGG